jgi:hypothetical protein
MKASSEMTAPAMNSGWATTDLRRSRAEVGGAGSGSALAVTRRIMTDAETGAPGSGGHPVANIPIVGRSAAGSIRTGGTQPGEGRFQRDAMCRTHRIDGVGGRLERFTTQRGSSEIGE